MSTAEDNETQDERALRTWRKGRPLRPGEAVAYRFPWDPGLTGERVSGGVPVGIVDRISGRWVDVAWGRGSERVPRRVRLDTLRLITADDASEGVPWRYGAPPPPAVRGPLRPRKTKAREVAESAYPSPLQRSGITEDGEMFRVGGLPCDPYGSVRARFLELDKRDPA